MPDDRELLDTRVVEPAAGQPPPRTAATDEAILAIAAETIDERRHPEARSRSASCSGSPSASSPCVLLSAILANLLPLQSPNFQNYNALNQGPSTAHWLGTDDLGRDLLARLVFGARVSLIVGFVGVVIGLIFGGTAGLISGYRGGRLDVALNAVSFIILAFPAIVAVIAIVTFWGASLVHITIILGHRHHPPHVPGHPGLQPVLRPAGLRGGGQDHGGHRHPDRAPGDPPQRDPGDRDLQPHHRGRTHRHRRDAGLPRTVRRPADAVVGEPDQRGDVQQPPQRRTRTSCCGRRWPCSCCCGRST